MKPQFSIAKTLIYKNQQICQQLHDQVQEHHQQEGDLHTTYFKIFFHKGSE